MLATYPAHLFLPSADYSSINITEENKLMRIAIMQLPTSTRYLPTPLLGPDIFLGTIS
jgi:hypothetical protein